MLAILESMEGYLAATVVALYSLLQIFFWGFWLLWRRLLFSASPLQGWRSRDFNLLFHSLFHGLFGTAALSMVLIAPAVRRGIRTHGVHAICHSDSRHP